MGWTARLVSVGDLVNGEIPLTYEYTDAATGRTFRETVKTHTQQTDAWVQNRGAGRAVELDALDAFKARAQAAIGPVVVTDHLATLPPPTQAELDARAWADKVNEAAKIKAAVSIGVATKADTDRLVVLDEEIKATYLPEYKTLLSLR